MQFKTLYPPIDKNFSDYIKVDDTHEIYYEESGNPEGFPVVFLHGGPGCGCDENSRRYFDPKFYRIIIFDQRGSGRSKPKVELKDNDTWHIIEDMEKIRKKLNIEKWLVFGGSWGSTLSLCYAIKHPQRVEALILRGIFLGRREDINWIYKKGGASKIYPESFEKFENLVADDKRDDLIGQYYKMLTSKDIEIRNEAAKRWSEWEGSIVQIDYDKGASEQFLDYDFAASMATIECHFWVNNMFWDDDNFILNNTNIIEDIPTTIVHGRYDMDCPVEQAYLLSKKLKKVDLRISPMSGHSSSEEENVHSLVDATDKFRDMRS
ncbi:MAG: prolyl aminopeptidase [Tissierellia bacterium]|nr:prolyl aminopeptidase [Tissierellia bacterium]